MKSSFYESFYYKVILLQYDFILTYIGQIYSDHSLLQKKPQKNLRILEVQMKNIGLTCIADLNTYFVRGKKKPLTEFRCFLAGWWVGRILVITHPVLHQLHSHQVEDVIEC